MVQRNTEDFEDAAVRLVITSGHIRRAKKDLHVHRHCKMLAISQSGHFAWRSLLLRLHNGRIRYYLPMSGRHTPCRMALTGASG